MHYNFLLLFKDFLETLGSLVYSANFYENTMLVPAHLKPPKNEWDSHTLTSSNSVTTVLT